MGAEERERGREAVVRERSVHSTPVEALLPDEVRQILSLSLLPLLRRKSVYAVSATRVVNDTILSFLSI